MWTCLQRALKLITDCVLPMSFSLERDSCKGTPCQSRVLLHENIRREICGLMTGHVCCSLLGDFQRTLSAGEAGLIPIPSLIPYFNLQRAGWGHAQRLRMLLHPAFCVLCRQSRTEYPVFLLETIGSCQSAVYRLDLWECWLCMGRVAGEDSRCSTTCVSVGWHHLCSVNIPVG